MYIDLFGLKQLFMEMGTVVAIATIKQLTPSFDELKYKEAVEIAGSERWLKYHIGKGNIHKIRRGQATNSPIYYSRLEIAAVKEAERQIQVHANEEAYRKQR